MSCRHVSVDNKHEFQKKKKKKKKPLHSMYSSMIRVHSMFLARSLLSWLTSLYARRMGVMMKKRMKM